jgi:hypothetical protein
MHESDETPTLATALRAVAEEDARTGAAPTVEATLLAEVRSIAAARKRRMVIATLAVAAAVLVALAVPMRRMLNRAPSDTARVEVTTEFLPLAYSSLPATSVQVVRLAVPRAALASFGLAPLETMDRTSADTVLADVLVGDDGLARAVRFVRPATGEEQMP